ncbi:hypothetical protein TVAG_331190 [Trichomonas vaginalis G3]|uniref:Uncharacterized protein n=1 Tax=Trichomonas vaginalis (strain ATCC PRA-98 / G3) TaxID=412133 RepID=A2FC38_TRIV3|nr:hypothetical protein TVAGG3_0757200 [Trichomonas vaginalis G3]EAX97533.1 hypothetical protein TVAG_331190 [Trichomonas vaginalis G3]KAI5512947.1 hypothetical protein TVAGG3_0757200 [Trichomonas vaginalis G3]|eukprot:XP_001310463.1 hypothetical protein [Trichomonas vaginalis G3]
MSSEDCDFGELSDGGDDFEQSTKASFDDETEEPVKKVAKPKGAPEPKKAKPKAVMAKNQTSNTNIPKINRVSLNLGQKLNLPPPRRIGLSKRLLAHDKPK